MNWNRRVTWVYCERHTRWYRGSRDDGCSCCATEARRLRWRIGYSVKWTVKRPKR